jgi:alanine dehydrogenase
MKIGIPKEIKVGENRVALVPEDVKKLVNYGHEVLVENNAGIGSGISDYLYRNSGAKIIHGHRDVFRRSDILVKIKEPLPEEYGYLDEGKILFSYLHLTEGVLGAKRKLAKAVQRSKVVAFSYECFQLDDGSRPLLAPMSEIAGHMSVIIGGYFLQKTFKGKGVWWEK